jgi:hypothetical protein
MNLVKLKHSRIEKVVEAEIAKYFTNIYKRPDYRR